MFALSIRDLKRLQTYVLGFPLTDPDTCQYRLISIIADIALFRLDKPVSPDTKTDSNRQFMHLSFTNKGIDAIHISNILHNKAKKLCFVSRHRARHLKLRVL